MRLSRIIAYGAVLGIVGEGGIREKYKHKDVDMYH